LLAQAAELRLRAKAIATIKVVKCVFSIPSSFYLYFIKRILSQGYLMEGFSARLQRIYLGDFSGAIVGEPSTFLEMARNVKVLRGAILSLVPCAEAMLQSAPL
jgi:hypothetical protein